MTENKTKEELLELLDEPLFSIDITRADYIIINALMGAINPTNEKAHRKSDKTLARLIVGLWANDIISLPLFDGMSNATTGDPFAGISPRDFIQLHPQYDTEPKSSLDSVPFVSFGEDETERKEEFLTAMEAKHGKTIADKFRDAMYQ